MFSIEEIKLMNKKEENKKYESKEFDNILYKLKDIIESTCFCPNMINHLENLIANREE